MSTNDDHHAAAPTNRVRRRAAVAALALPLLLAACTSAGDDATAPASTAPVADTADQDATDTTADGYTPAFASPDADDFNHLLAPTADLAAVQPASILNVDRADEAAGLPPNSLVVAFEMESHYCYGVRSTVTETDTEISISLETGLLPGIDGNDCAYGVYPYTTAVTLAAPLGDRKMVAGEPLEPGDDSATAARAIGDGGESSDEDSTDPDDSAGVEQDDGGEADDGTENTAGGVVPVGGAATLIGMHVEDGVAWAIDNDVEWRILTYDGEPHAPASDDDPRRLSFVVESDKIVSFEWS